MKTKNYLFIQSPPQTFICWAFDGRLKPVVEIIRGWGQLPPPQFSKTRKFSEEVGNFEGWIETAMKKRVAVERERVSILNEQKMLKLYLQHIFKFLSTNNIPF